ncbi:DUF4359 domain-containing protein [Paenibacillus yanchengensis]|uniref:DUF4359 domain-containing protein n=1 Tax=Paenibacillus yanchengensis TaxID=2035833 RepID=A0ABW4YIS6_9BACL
MIHLKKSIVVIVIILLFVAVITKPTKDDYIAWVKEELKQELNAEINKGKNKEIGKQFVNLGVNMVGSFVVDNTTSCKDYLLFKVCNTNILDSKEMTALGLYNNFIRLK